MPKDAEELIKALELDKNGKWEGAHKIVQDIESKHASWIHAYLHRKEGDLSNAGYWYSRAGEQRSDLSLDEEWQHLHDVLAGQ